MIIFLLKPQVRMVTGDNLQTAKAIALECGILGSDAEANDPNIIEGKVFRALSDKEREKVAQKITVCSKQHELSVMYINYRYK